MRSPDLFFQTITPEILSPADYVDWDNIKSKIKEIRREIALLQSLDKDDPIKDLADILNKEPRVLKVLQLLIAHTPTEIHFDDLNKHIYFDKDVMEIKKNISRAIEIASIFIEIGLVEFLKEVKSVEDVIKGVLIGLEPNSRKNRRGNKLEEKIDSIVNSVVKEIKKEKNINISAEFQMYVNLAHERKQIDCVILKDNKPRIAIEVNFYSSTGSKPSEVLGRAYPEVQQSLKKKGIKFIVITDGLGWLKMKPVIRTAFEKLDSLMNIKQAERGKLKEVIIENILNE